MTDNAANLPIHDGILAPVRSIQELRVFVVDDSEHMLKLLRQFLAILGVRNVRTFANGESALKALAYDDAHLVITDLNMRPMSGLQLITAVRLGTNVANPEIPIVVVTGSADSAAVQRLGAAGANGVLAKPVSLASLRERIRPLLPASAGLDAETRTGSWAFQI